MLWRPSCPPFCKHVTDMSEINFNMLNRLFDLKNLCVATKSMCLAHILKKILRILSFGGHLGRHLEYFNFPNDAKVESFSFNVRTYWRTHLCKIILCGLFFWVAPKIFIWQPDYIVLIFSYSFDATFRYGQRVTLDALFVIQKVFMRGKLFRQRTNPLVK